MLVCLVSTYLIVSWNLCRGSLPPVENSLTAKECTDSYCYHIVNQDKNISWSMHRRFYRDWKTLAQLGDFCQEKVSPSSWPLEIYSEDEQRFLEKFLRRHESQKLKLNKRRPILVPLNLNVTLLNSWTWLDGDEASNMSSNPSEHFAYLHVNASKVEVLTSSSDLPYHMGLCHINRRHCKYLRSTFLIDGYCMYKIRERLTWHQARMECHQRSGRLTSVVPGFRFGFPRSEPNAGVEEPPPHYMATHREMWIGLKDIDEIWMQNNGCAVYTNWGGDPVVPFTSDHDFAFIDFDSMRWSVSIPQAFELKIVCMTENTDHLHKDDVKNQTLTDILLADCRPVITWMVVTIVVVSLVALTFMVACIRDHFRSGIPLKMRFARREDNAFLCSFEETPGFDGAGVRGETGTSVNSGVISLH